MPRPKHRNDHNHAKHGYIGGNPRYSKSRGHRRGMRAAVKARLKREGVVS